MIRRNEAGRLVAEYAALVPDELEQALAEDAIVYLPMGSIEWHNAHLPFDTDSIIGEGLCKLLAERSGGLILPPNPWATACTFAKRGPYIFEPALGTVALFDNELYLRLLRAIVQGILENGFKRIVILAGHVGREDREAMEKVANEVNSTGRARLLFLHPYLVTRGDHAGHHETLMLLGIRPELVRKEKRYVPYQYGTSLTGAESIEDGRAKVAQTVEELYAKVRQFFGLP